MHLTKFKRKDIIQCMLLDRNEIKVGISQRKIAGKSPNIWKLNNTLLNNIWVKEEISKEIQIYFELNKMKTQFIKMYEIPQELYLEGNL